MASSSCSSCSGRTRRPSSASRRSRSTASGAWSSATWATNRPAFPRPGTATGSSSRRSSRRRRVPEFGPQSKVREVVASLGERGREALRRHGYDVGDGFVDVLSQYQRLEHAARTERLRDLEGLLAELNAAG